MEIPGVKAYWRDVIVDSNGFIWLQYPSNDVEETMDTGRRFRILTPEGEYLGDTTVPLSGGQVAFGKFMGIRWEVESGLGMPSVFTIRPIVEGLVYPN